MTIINEDDNEFELREIFKQVNEYVEDDEFGQSHDSFKAEFLNLKLFDSGARGRFFDLLCKTHLRVMESVLVQFRMKMKQEQQRKLEFETSSTDEYTECSTDPTVLKLWQHIKDGEPTGRIVMEYEDGEYYAGEGTDIQQLETYFDANQNYEVLVTRHGWGMAWHPHGLGHRLRDRAHACDGGRRDGGRSCVPHCLLSNHCPQLNDDTGQLRGNWHLARPVSQTATSPSAVVVAVTMNSVQSSH